MPTRLTRLLTVMIPTALVLLVLSTPQGALAADRPPISPDNAPLPDPLPDPSAVPLPIADTEPQSSWRPPLYPIPWALTAHDHFFFQRPVTVDYVNWPLPSYRYGGVFFAPDVPHTGIDIVVPEGTAVLAAGDGQVIWAGTGLLFGDDDKNDPYGIAVAIKHNFGWEN